MHEYRLDGKFAYHNLSTSSKDEWVISRVFQKNEPGSNPTGGTKKRLTSTVNHLYQEVSSPSSVNLPPLLDASPYATTASSSSALSTDRERCSFDRGKTATKEHVPCFSTATAPSTFNMMINSCFDLPIAPPPPPPPQPTSDITIDGFVNSSSSRWNRNNNNNFGASPTFPSLKSLQENLQIPFYFSAAAAQPPMHGGADQHMGGFGPYGSSLGNWSAPENQKVAPSELDCMWSY